MRKPIISTLAVGLVISAVGCGKAPADPSLAEASASSTPGENITYISTRPITMTTNKSALDIIGSQTAYIAAGTLVIPNSMTSTQGAGATDGIIDLFIGDTIDCVYRTGTNATPAQANGTYALQAGQSSAECVGLSITLNTGTKVVWAFRTGYNMGYQVVVDITLN